MIQTYKAFLETFAMVFAAAYIAFECKDERYWIMWLLPLTYLFVKKIIDIAAGHRRNEFGYKIIKLVMFFRYVCTPILVIASEFYGGYGFEPSENTITLAIVLMVYELVSVGVAIYIYNRVQISHKNLETIKSYTGAVQEKCIGLWIYTIIALVILVSIDVRLVIPNNLLIINSELENANINTGIENMVLILRNTFRVILAVLLLNTIKNSGFKERTKAVFSVITMIIIIAMHTSTGRWDLLILSIVGINLLMSLYPRDSKMIAGVLILIMIIALTSATIYKFWGYTSSEIFSDNFMLGEIIHSISMQFQAYFSGPRNVGLAIDMSEGLNVEFSWLINDILGSLPVFSRFFDQELRFNLLYNQYIYSNNIIAQIIPMVGIGYSVFGLILAPIITVIFELLVLKLNDIYMKRTGIFDKYLLLYMMTYTAMCMGLNIQIITNKYYALFLPSIFLILINRQITNTKKLY